MSKGLKATAALWPAVQVVYAWVWQAAHLLGEQGPGTVAGVRRQLGGLVGAMVRHRAKAGSLGTAVDHFVKVTRSYWAGLFHCYAVKGLPRTNNDLEQFFGSHRYHERRASGRKGGSPTVVVRGPVRLVAALVTRQKEPKAEELVPRDQEKWRRLREELQRRRGERAKHRRFRRNPEAYLRHLESKFSQSRLPA